MTKRDLKKVTVASIFFTIFIFIPAFVVFIFTDFSPVRINPPEPKGIKVKSVKKIKLSESKVGLAAEVRNPNPDFGLRTFDYNFVVKGGAEELILSKGTSFILPSQTKHLIKLEVPVSEVPKGQLGLKLEELDWQRSTDVRTDSLWVAGGTYTTEASSTKITGTLINESPLLIEEVQVRALIFAKDGSLLGMTRTQFGDVRSGEKRDIKTYIGNPISQEGTLIFEADANLLNDVN